MTITPQRILADLEAIAAFSECPATVGHSRPTFSHPWVQSRDYVIDQANRAGCKSKIDAAGNVHIRPDAVSWDAKVWLSGSHIDSVPTGGKYDGVVGIVCPLEVLRAAHEAGRKDLPLELIIFAEEEGTTFGLGMIGSRLWTGDLTPEMIAHLKNKEGKNYLEAGGQYGVKVDELVADRIRPSSYIGLIEVHIEQGPFLEAQGRSSAVVNAISGRKQFLVSVHGVPNHAGAAPMKQRRDALAGAAQLIGSIESMALGFGHPTVGTVGRLRCEPNAINVVPGFVEFTIDFRTPDASVLDVGEDEIREAVARCEAERQIAVECVRTEDQPPILMNDDIVNRMVRAVENGTSTRAHQMPSGALHDAAILAPVMPTAMLFVASKGGISHNPAEFSRIEDIAEAARVLARVVESEK